MIIELKFKNWTSFRDEECFVLAATQEKRLKNRLPKIRKSPVLNVSPIAALYGGNASGKTNFFKLLSFLKKMVVFPLYDESEDIPLETFKFDSDNKISEISLTFLTADDKIYTLELNLSANEIIKEKLFLVKSTKLVPIYSRNHNKVELISEKLKKDAKAKAFTLVLNKNQLFLAISGAKVSELQCVWKWFQEQLVIINTKSGFNGYMDMVKTNPIDFQTLGNLLKDLDTGMCKLDVVESDLSVIPVKFNLEKLKMMLTEGKVAEFNFHGLRLIISKEQSQLKVKKIISFHKNSDGKLIEFDLQQESEGSLRLLDILPAFIDLEKKDSKYVYIIDDLDRNLHSMLSRRLLVIYLSNCSENSRSQLIFSTHDLLLMDQNLFRRDEMWISERQEDGASNLFSLAGSNIRYDKDIRKMYLQGALGGVPKLVTFGNFIEA